MYINHRVWFHENQRKANESKTITDSSGQTLRNPDRKHMGVWMGLGGLSHLDFETRSFAVNFSVEKRFSRSLGVDKLNATTP